VRSGLGVSAALCDHGGWQWMACSDQAQTTGLLPKLGLGYTALGYHLGKGDG
jgi:hypothetical protein